MTDATAPAPAIQTNVNAGLGALFDFSFKHFITLSVIKVLYMLGLVLLALEWLVMVIVGFSMGGFVGGLGALVLGTISIVIAVIFLRVWLELICVIFRIGENTTALVERGRM